MTALTYKYVTNNKIHWHPLSAAVRLPSLVTLLNFANVKTRQIKVETVDAFDSRCTVLYAYRKYPSRFEVHILKILTVFYTSILRR